MSGCVYGMRFDDHISGLVPWAVDPPIRLDATRRSPCGSVRYHITVNVTPLLTRAEIQLCRPIQFRSRGDRHIILGLVSHLCTRRIEGSKDHSRQTDVLSIRHDIEVRVTPPSGILYLILVW